MSIKFTFLNEVTGLFDGLSPEIITDVKNSTSVMEPGSHMSAAFKMKVWDGKTSLFKDNGIFPLIMLDDVLDVLAEYDITDEDIEVEDLRENLLYTPEAYRNTVIDKDRFISRGWTLYPHQVDAINNVLHNEKGIIEVGTSGGKSRIMAGVATLYSDDMKSLTITKDSKLCDQLLETYEELGLGAVVIDARTPPKKRKTALENASHVITTKKIAMNMSDTISGFDGVLLIDEIHEFGEEFESFVFKCLGDCPIRVGLTGTLPEKKKEALKRLRILSAIGGDVLIDVNVGELHKGGFVADFKVEMIEINDLPGAYKQTEIGFKEWEWPHELTHLSTSESRVDAIVEAIQTVWNGKNALILAKPQVGKVLAEKLGLDFIDENVPMKVREEYFAEFDGDGYQLCASYETVATGISINRIFNVFLIDAGPNPRYIGQGIGRGLRKDGVEDKINVYDIYSNTKFSKKQETVRKSYYRKKGYPFFKSDLKIEVPL